MPKFILVARDNPAAFAEVSPEEMQQIIQKYVAWGQRLHDAGKLIVSHKLKDNEGRVLRSNGADRDVTDGPYSETKEIIGGFWLIEAADYQEVLDLCENHPHLRLEASLEVRAIEDL
jgi:hypothetical protein